MKKRVILLLISYILLLFSTILSQAQSKKLIHYWHFNNTTPSVHLGSLPADYSSIGNASIIYKPKPGGGSDTLQSYLDNLAGDTINQRVGYAGCCSGTNYGVRTRNPSDYMQFLWYLPTNKYQNIVIKYETQTSSLASGQHRQVYSYSIDSSASFITTGLPVAFDSAGISWGKVVLNLSSINSINNNGRFVFKITFTPPNTGTSGNNRFDNISVEGDTMIAPVITSIPLNIGIIGRSYKYIIRSTGTPVASYSISGSPTWLTLTDSTLSGIPDTMGTFGPITIKATNGAGSDQQILNLVIGDSIVPVSPIITSTAPVSGVLNTLYSYIIRTTGIPIPSLSINGAPSWLIFTDSVLSGIPLESGIFGPITISSTNIAGNVQQSFSITIPSAPEITSLANIAGIANVAYTYPIITTGTPAPILSVNGNPSWLSLNGNILTGTPSLTGTYGPITITATNSEGSAQQSFSILVSSLPSITSTSPITGSTDSVYTYEITTTGTPDPLVSVQDNPSWLTLNGDVLSGRPFAAGIYGPITIEARNIAGYVKQIFYIEIKNPALNTSDLKLIHYWHFNNTLPVSHLGAIPADYSTLGHAYIQYRAIPGGGADTAQAYLDNLTGDTLNQRSGYAGCCGAMNYAIRTRNPSDNMEFLWSIPTTDYYNILIQYETESSSTTSGPHRQQFSYSLDSGITFSTVGLAIKSDSAGLAWGSVILDLSNIPEVNNTNKLILKMTFTPPNTGTNGNNRFDNITVEGDSLKSPVFLSNPIAAGIINRMYFYTLKVGGAPIPDLSLSGNPGWLNLVNSILSGIPPSAGTFGPITITATNILGTVNQEFYLQIADSVNPIAPAITSLPSEFGKIDSVFSYTIHITGIPKPTISVTGLPSWLQFADSIISGIPLTNGQYGPINITASNILGSVQQSFSITVPEAPVITSTAVTQAVANYPYTYTIAVTGTPKPQITISGLPFWLSFSGNMVSGIPVAADTIGPITITASNTQGSIQQIFNIAVLSEPLFLSSPDVRGVAGQKYSYTVAAIGTPTPILSIKSGPSWLSLDGNTLSGTPNSLGLIGPVQLVAANSIASVYQTFFLKIANTEVNTSGSELIHYWHFNNTIPLDGSGGLYYGTNPILSDYSANRQGSIVYEPLHGVLSDTGHIDNLPGDILNEREGFGGCCGVINNAVRMRNPSDSMQLLFYIPTRNFRNIVMKYETESSSTKSGQHGQLFSYSLDSAITFITTGLPVESNFADTVWQLVTLDLRDIEEVNNNNKLVLKINFLTPNTGSKGNNRFDNITVEGDSISIYTEISNYSDREFKLYPNPASEEITLISASDGQRIVNIYNSTGLLIKSINTSGKNESIDISILKAGFYFIRITEINGDKEYVLKFVKV
jgi:hypothetical protein